MLINKAFIATLLTCGLLLGFMSISYAAESQSQVVPVSEQVVPAQTQAAQSTAPAQAEDTEVMKPVTSKKAVGRVVWVKGDFKAFMPSKEARVLKKGSVLYVNDKLVTGKKTQAQIIFTDQSLMTFRERTEFVIEKYSYNPEAKGDSVGSYVMNLIEGGFRTITGLIAKKNPTDYSVDTPVATIGVRGTDYSVYYRKGEMFIGFDKGIPCVTSKTEEQKSLCLDEENKYAKVEFDSVPVPLDIRPDFLGPILEIVPASIGPYNPSNSTTVRQVEPGEVVNSFCIT